MKKLVFTGTAFILLAMFQWNVFAGNNEVSAIKNRTETLMNDRPQGYPVATLAGGCFWCVESVFRGIDGILHTRVGYTGGDLQNPSYRQITTGQTGHAEAVEITYDPEKLDYKGLLEIFFRQAHDPTQLNRQGVDVGPQYRSAIFVDNDEQRTIAQNMIADFNAEKTFGKPVVTKVNNAEKFWPAENYHQQYYEKYEEETGKTHIRYLMKHKNKEKVSQ